MLLLLLFALAAPALTVPLNGIFGLRLLSQFLSRKRFGGLRGEKKKDAFYICIFMKK